MRKIIDYVSPSQIGTFHTCPESWRRRYICGEKIPPGIAAVVGTGVHKGAEHALVYRMEKEEPESRDTTIMAAVENYEHKLESDGVFMTREDASAADRIIGENKDNTAKLAGFWHDELYGVLKPVAVEERLRLSDPRLATDLLGVIDVREKHKLRDLKTAGKKWNEGRAAVEVPPTVYNWLAESAGIVDGEFTYDILVNPKKPSLQTVNTHRDMSDRLVLIEQVNTMCAQIKAGNFIGAEPGAWKCSPKWCGFFGSCRFISDRLKTLPRTK